jgi:hypothetical protein
MAEPSVDPYAPPQEDGAKRNRSMPALLPGELARGAYVAGGVLCINAALTLAERTLTMTASQETAMNGILPVMIDIAIGVALLLRKPQVVTIAIIRCVVGAVFFSVAQIAAGNPMMVAFQIAVSGSLLALLVGNASKPRIYVACAVYGIYALFEIFGIAVLATRG